MAQYPTRDREAAGSSLTGATGLWSLSKTHLSKLSTGSTQEDRPCLIERLLMGRKESNQTKYCTYKNFTWVAPVHCEFAKSTGGKDMTCEAFFSTSLINSTIEKHEFYRFYHMALSILCNPFFREN